MNLGALKLIGHKVLCTLESAQGIYRVIALDIPGRRAQIEDVETDKKLWVTMSTLRVVD